MKTTFTRFFSILAFSLLLNVGLIAQTTHNVDISGFAFVPGGLTIDVGDDVVWTNSTGTGHNVNGTTATFPGNPESFGNTVGTAWTYTYTFTTAGSYTYRCDPHSGVMLGQITVNNTVGIKEANDETGIKVYPNPAETVVNFDMKDIEEEMEISLYNAIGAKVKVLKLTKVAEATMDINELPSGMYLYQIEAGNTVLKTGKLMVK